MPKSAKKQNYILGVTIGRFSPFHKGNSLVFKRIAPYCNKIVVFVAGQKESVENPFSYELRKQIIDKSLGPIMYKTSVKPAILKKGKKIIQTGFIYSFLDKMDISESVDGILVFVGTDRYQEYRKQLKEAQAHNAKLKKVRVVNGGIGLNEFGSKIDATAIRGALLSNDAPFIKNYLATPISDNPNFFKEIYGKMRQEIDTTYDAQEFEKLAQKSEDDDSKKKQ